MNTPSKRVVPIVTTMAVFLTAFMGSSISIALPTIGKEFAMDAVLMGWVVTVYPLAAAAFLIPFGRLADIYGKKKFFNYGIVTFTVSSLLCAISPAAALLIFFRFYPPAPERTYYRLTKEGIEAGDELCSNPLFTLYPDVGPSHMKTKIRN